MSSLTTLGHTNVTSVAPGGQHLTDGGAVPESIKMEHRGGVMASYQSGNLQERQRPWLARTWKARKPTYLGYYRTRAEAELAEQRARDNDGGDIQTQD
jgi:hypothetical protein